MKRIDGIAEAVAYCREARSAGMRIGLVPTMGALHDGHLALARAAAADTDLAVVSVFVNPLQFGPNEDFEAYPRDLDADCARLDSFGIGAVFTTSPDEMYPDAYRTFVIQEEMVDTLCGPFRPGHFRGVTTVVAKLFHIVQPHVAYFGQKDAQQCILIQRMVKDLNFDLDLRILATVRDPDGLAMSSRNAYLTPEERGKALALYRALSEANGLFEGGERRAAALLEAMDRIFADVPEMTVEYRQVVALDDVRDLEMVEDRALVAAGARLGRTRLIDNQVLGAGDLPNCGLI